MSNVSLNPATLSDEEIEILDLTDHEEELLAELDFDGHHYPTGDADTCAMTDEYFAMYESGVDESVEDLLDGLHIDNPGVVDYE